MIFLCRKPLKKDISISIFMVLLVWITLH